MGQCRGSFILCVTLRVCDRTVCLPPAVTLPSVHCVKCLSKVVQDRVTELVHTSSIALTICYREE